MCMSMNTETKSVKKKCEKYYKTKTISSMTIATIVETCKYLIWKVNILTTQNTTQNTSVTLFMLSHDRIYTFNETNSKKLI